MSPRSLIPHLALIHYKPQSLKVSNTTIFVNMKFSNAIAAAALALVAITSPVQATTTTTTTTNLRHLAVKVAPVCPTKCPTDTYCARGDFKCRSNSDPAVRNKCFNPANFTWIDKCAPGFFCHNSKCLAKDGGLCYKTCAHNSYCARYDTVCRTQKETGKCFDVSTSTWIAKCAKDYTCVQSKCVKKN
ncbi:hypothetical protein Poli38472_012657 [Pythium oligandrum]|uniref:Uncharacterized protein n=1 Tax=Pythium oligandrum TaxID=41045 RepID=A0A8K1CEN6_PYTOL|nr:hypothetical protein Poli38472_012657 [Pythium oligandrum]|eukprot:TMW61466.1 hypothetical protein Poli38472_012657 [Pythium oligandrum]